MSALRGVVMIFAKAPVAGKAKTRLIPALGEEGAARLHHHLLDTTVAMAAAQSRLALQLWCSPDCGHDAFHKLHSRFPVELFQQQGDDLGQRMAFAFEQALHDYDFAIIIGTDCPELASGDLEQCAALLQQGEDAVLGPAADGGYYLLGLSRYEPQLFDAVAWGSDKVLAQTREKLGQSGFHYAELTLRHDLDRPDDLEYFSTTLPTEYQDYFA